MAEPPPKRQKLTLRGVVLDDGLLADYVEATDTPPPLPLDLDEAHKAGFTGSPSHHSALCNGCPSIYNCQRHTRRLPQVHRWTIRNW